MSSKKKTSKKSARSGGTAAATSGKTAPAAKKKASKKKTVAKPAPAATPAAGREVASRAETASKPPVQAPAATASGSGLTRLALIASLLALVIAAYAAYQFTLSGTVTSAQVMRSSCSPGPPLVVGVMMGSGSASFFYIPSGKS